MLIAAIATAIAVTSELRVGKATKSTNYMMAIAARANQANANVEPPYHILHVICCFYSEMICCPREPTETLARLQPIDVRYPLQEPRGT